MFDELQSGEAKGRTFVTIGMDGSTSTTEIEPIPGMEVCDFCSTPNPTYAFEADDVTQTVEGVDMVSVGGWAACSRCAMLVKANDRESLMERSLKVFDEKHPEYVGLPEEARAQIRETLKATIDSFFAAWRG